MVRSHRHSLFTQRSVEPATARHLSSKPGQARRGRINSCHQRRCSAELTIATRRLDRRLGARRQRREYETLRRILRPQDQDREVTVDLNGEHSGCYSTLWSIKFAGGAYKGAADVRIPGSSPQTVDSACEGQWLPGTEPSDAVTRSPWCSTRTLSRASRRRSRLAI